MNQRIIELAIAAAPVNCRIPQSEWNIPKEFIENFAELLIRECAEVASSYDGAYYVGTAIANHFGVEE